MMCIRPPIHSSTHPFVHPSIHPPIHPPIHQHIQVSSHPSTSSSTHSSINPSIHLFINPFKHQSIHPFIHITIYAFVHSSSHTPSTRPPNVECIHLIIYPPIQPLTPPHIYNRPTITAGLKVILVATGEMTDKSLLARSRFRFVSFPWFSRLGLILGIGLGSGLWLGSRLWLGYMDRVRVKVIVKVYG